MPLQLASAHVPFIFDTVETTSPSQDVNNCRHLIVQARFVLQDLLGENFRRQMLMDGQYGSITFICTKTDVIQVNLCCMSSLSDLTDFGMLLISDTHTYASELFALPINLHVHI